MGLIVLAFVVILMVTFAMVYLVTSQSAAEKIVERRMAFIHVARANKGGVPVETEQLLKQTIVGRFPLLDALLVEYSVVKTLNKKIMQAGSKTTVATLLLTSLGLFLAGFGLVWLFTTSVIGGLGAGAVLGFLPYGLLTWRRQKRISAFNAVLAEAIDMLSRALRAGHSVLGAIGMLAESAQQPAAAEFSEVFKQMNLGLPMRDALMQLTDRVPSADLLVLVTAIMVQKDTGGNLVDILERTVFVIRERLRIEGEIQTQTAQGRLTGWILSALPLVMLVLLNLVNPGYSSVLVHDPLGRKLSYYSLGMLVTGAYVIRRIINGIEV